MVVRGLVARILIVCREKNCATLLHPVCVTY